MHYIFTTNQQENIPKEKWAKDLNWPFTGPEI